MTLRKFLFLILAGFVLLLHDSPLTADTSDVFVQTDWQGGSSSANAVHPTNKTGWTNYFSKDSYLNTSIGGRMAGSPELLSVTDTSDTDFTAGTKSSTLDISGSGVAASLVLQGTNDDAFVDNLGQWTSLPEVPALTYWSPYARAGNYIYALFRYKTFGRFDITTEKWEILTDFPAVTGYGAALAYPGSGDFIYATRGGTTKDFYQYSISGGTWTKLTDVTYQVGQGASLAAYGSAIYCLVGGGTNKFYSYSIAGNSWTTLPTATTTVTRGGSLVYPGSGTDLYAIFQNGSTTFSRFSIPGNAWVALTAAPQSVANLSYPGTGNYLYAWYEADTYWNRIARYNFVTPGWEDLTPPAKTANSSTPPIYPYRGIFYYLGSGTKVKWLSMGNLAKPMTFDTATLTWDELIGPKYLNNIGYGARAVWDGSDYIYFLRSDGAAEFSRYTISTNAWINRAAPPWNTYRGAGMVYLGGKVYLQQGYAATGFASYDPSTNLWTSLAGMPAAVDSGGSIATDGTNIYSFRGATTPTFWKYTVSSNTWAALPDAPANIDYGGSLLRPATDDSIYATCGGNTKTFYKYSISGNSWAQLDDAPYYFTNKAFLTYPGSGDYIYAFNGQDQTFARYKFRNSGGGAWEVLPPAPIWEDMYYVASSAGDKVYAMRTEWDMNSYTISSGTWNTTRNYDMPITAGYGSVVYTGGDIVYLIYGDNTTLFWKYSISQKRWVGLVKVPFMLGAGTKAAYPGTGNYIYLIEGRYSNHLWQYDFVNDTWTARANAPVAFYGGSQLDGIGDVLYAIQGRDPAASVNDQRGNGFFKYTISTNTWATLATLPSWITNGSERGNNLVHVPSQGKLYWKRGNGGTGFYEYNIGSGVWTAKTSLPVGAYNGQALYYPGSGDYIYNVQNNSTPPTFYRYSISGNTWTRLANPSRGGGYTGNDGDMFYPGTGDYLYYFDASVGYFARYSLNRDDWDQPLTLPSYYSAQYYSAFGNGVDGDTFYSGGYRNFWKYTISTRIWSTLRSPYDDIGWEWNGQWSPEMANPGSGNFIYATRGRNYSEFARYSVSQNQWSALKAPTADGLYNFGDGHRLAATTSRVYCLRGASTRNFWSYNIATNTWSTLADLPTGMTVNYGSSLCYPGTGNYIYATRGDGSSDFFRYSISGNTWTQLASLPIVLLATDTNGASLIYPGRGDYLYFVPGSNYIQSAPVAYFYRYSVSQNTWTEIASAPAGFGGSAKIIYPGSGDYLYATRGGAGLYYDVLKYRLFKQGLYTSPIKDIGRNQSYDTVTWTNNGQGTLEFKVRTSTSSTLSDAADWSSIATTAKGGNLSDTYPVVKPNDLYLQYQMGFFTDDLTKLPSLDSISISYNKYRHQQELISSAYNSGQVHNRLMKLSWSETVPSGTDVRFQIRTAPDNGGQPGTWSAWLGPTGTQTLNDDYSTDSDYAYGPTVEVVDGVGRLKMILDTYAYTQRIFLDNSANSTTYTDIVQAIDLTSANNHFWSHVKSDGSDIRFVDGAGNNLSFNLATNGASFDYAAQTAKIYVRLATLPANQKTTIFLKYGKADAVSASDPAVMGLPASNNLVAYYRFDEGSGSVAVDSSGHGNNGTLVNSPTWGAGERNTGLTFNGTNQYIDLGSDASLKLSLPLTFGMWVNLPTGISGSWRHLISCTSWSGNPGYDTMLYSNTNLIMSVNGSETTTPRPTLTIATAEWHHITYSVSSTTSKIYIDGVLRQTWNGSWSLSPSAYNAWIGYSPASGYNYFYGSMDEVVIYNKDLSDTEVTQLYQGSGASVAPYYFAAVEDNTSSPSLSGWDYRNTVEIDNALGGNLANYQVQVVLTPGHEEFWSRCRSDGADVRFVDSDNTTILSYYTASFDYANKSATFWVKVPSIQAGVTKNIYLYYGRSDAASASSISGTMVKDFGETGPRNAYGLSVDGLGIKATVASSEALSPAQAVTVEANVKYGIDYWPSGWSYRKAVTLDNAAGQEKINGGVQFDVPVASGKMKADYSDLRFWETDHSQKLRYRVVSYDAAKATVYVLLPYLPAGTTKTIYVYYGNATATSESDSSLVPYIFYDDFNGSLSQWASSGAAQTTVDGRTAAVVTTGYLQGTSLLPFQAGHTYTIEYSARASGGGAFVGLGTNSARNSTGIGASGYLLGLDQLFWTNSGIYNQIGNGTSTWSTNRISYATSAWYTNKMTWVPSTSVNYNQNSSQYTESQTSYVPAYNDTIYPTIRASGGFIYVDYIKIYESSGYDITSITPSFGTEQPDPQVANPTFIRWLPGFGYRKKITIDNTGGTAKTDFVTTFHVAFVSGKMQVDYDDIRFVDTDGKKLSYNINSYDGSNASVSVKIPVLPENSTKSFYLYYGNATTTNEKDATVRALPSSGLMAWWKCDEGTGTVLVDSSGNSRTGTLQGTATWTTGKFGNALSLNNGWVSVPAMTPGAGEGSLSAWIQITSSTNQPLIDGVAGFWMSEYSATGRLGFDVNRNNAWADGGGGQTTGLYVDSVPFSTWVHIVVTFEDGVVKIYQNGILVNTKSYSGGNLTDQTVSGSGGLGRWGTTYGTGILDDVAVYNRTLSASEVAGIYDGQGITPTFATEESAPASIDQSIVMKSGAYGLKFSDAGLTAVLNGTTLSTTLYDTGRFMHVAMTYDRSALKLFVNGAEKATTPLSAAITTNGNNLTVGEYINGAVDETRVWNIARLGGSINEDQLKYISGSSTGLVSYLRFNEGIGTLGVDASIYANNATLSSATWLADPFQYSNAAADAIYHMDEGSGTSSADSSGNSNTLTLSGTTWVSSDLTGFTGGKSLNFNGATSYAAASPSSSLDVTGQISIEAWIKPLTTSGIHTIVSKGSDTNSQWNYQLMQSSDAVAFQFYNGATKQHVVTPGFLVVSNTYYIVATFDESTDTVNIYANGALLYTNTVEPSMMKVNTYPFYIGREASGATPFSGGIDEVRIYKRVLSADEVLTHYEKRLLALNEPEVYHKTEPTVATAVGAYVTDNPVIQPVMGVFYTDSNLIQFQEISNKPFGTEIKYQVSYNGYQWYWWDGVEWKQVTGGYSQANTASEVNSHLAAFQELATEGDFYYRAYLHSEPYAFMTPSLDNIGTSLLTDDSYYVSADGSTAINPLHSDADSDQWFQYKAILYSEGEDTSFLDDVSLEYVNSYIQVLSPNGGEVEAVGSTLIITWSAQSIQTDSGNGLVTIEYSTDGGSTYHTIASNVPNTGTYNWTIPDMPSQQALIRISSEDLPVVSDVSNAVFRILSLQVTSPNGGEAWETGKTHNITWDVTGAIPNNVVKIEYSTDGSTNWQTISAVAPNTGTYSWTVPAAFSDAIKVRISSPTNSAIMDTSDAAFSILPLPAFTISSPAGGEEWSVGAAEPISWRTNSLLFSNNVILEYSTDDFLNNTHAIATVSAGTPQGVHKNDDIVGSYNWTVPDFIATSVKVRVREESIPAGRDTQQEMSAASSAFSIIEPKISVTSPTTGDVWVVGDSHAITWATQGQASNDLKLEYSINGTAYNLIADHQTNNGTYSWTVPAGAVGSAVYIRITDNQRTQVTGVSSAFTVLAHATIEVIAPHGGETLAMGTDYTVQWRSYGQKLESGGADYNKISISYSINNGSSWTLAAFDRANTGSYTWHVPDSPTTQALIKVEDQNDALAAGVSSAVFTIVLPTITLTSPNGGETWYATGNYNITWTSIGSVSNVKLEYSTNGGSTWTQIATGRPNTGTYLWSPIADVNTSQARIRITDVTYPTVTSTSAANFTITPPTITLTVPNGGESWAVGTTQSVRWYSVGHDYGAVRDNLTIQYSTNGGTSWTNVTTSEVDDGFYDWVVPDTVGTTCRVKILDATRPATADSSDANFAITLPSITVTAPNGGEEWPIGTQQQITWTSLGSVSNNLTIVYSKDNFVTSTTIATGVADVGTYTWTVPDDLSAVAKVRITDGSRPAVWGASNNTFSIVNPRINITYPNGGELLSVGDVENITWQNIGSVTNSLLIEYSKDSFVTATTIAATAPNTGTYAWTIPNDVSATVKIRVTDNGRSLVWDKSDANFTILPTPAITVTSPVLNDVWRVGTVHNITWTDNGGRISNNLTLQYSTDSGSTWSAIAAGQPNNGTYAWTIPDNVSTTAMVRIVDADRLTTTANSALFHLADPLITITSPNGGDIWSVGDPGPVRWTTAGIVSENLVLEYSPDAGVTWYLVRGGIPNTGSYSWTIPDYVTSQCLVRLKDGNRPATVDVSDAVFTINPMPTITITSPVGGQEYVLGQTMNVTWEWTGIAISNLTLDYSNDNFVTRRIIATNLSNTGSYSWTIPADALTGQTIQLRLTDGTRTQITDKSNGYIRIRGGFLILTPNGGEQWVAKSDHTITWQTLGTIPTVKLEYSIDGSNWVYIGSPVNSGSYTWVLPDVQSTTAQVRISDADDSTTTDSSDANFSIVYATVVFRVMDYDSLQHLTDFSVSEPATGWSDSGLSSPLTRTSVYPYGAYTTFFTKLNYIDNSVSWNPPKQGTTPYNITVYLENSTNAQVSWEAILTYSFSPANDTLSAVGSLQRKGKLIGTTETERADLGAATLTIYEPDGQTVRNSLVAATPANTGMYNFTLTDTNFEGGKVYPATLTIEYRAHPYISSANIDVGSEIMQYQFFTQTAAQLTQSVSNIEHTVAATADEIKTEVKGAIANTKNELKADTARILTATEQNIPTKIEETRTMVDTLKKSEILNMESTIKQGDTLMIRYRTFSGLKPTIDVYNASNTQEIAGATMTEIGQTGIYEYPVQFSQSWGKGDFSIVCSEASRGSLDALTLTVQTTDIEQVYNQVSSVVGATAGLPNMTSTIANLSTQFAAIESVLTRTSQDIVSGVRNAMGSTTTLGTLYTQLKTVSKQVQAMGGDKGINLEKLYNVSEDRQQDMLYLKNKTQELKATMELNKKLIENISNKPVVQTWYEYKQ